MTSGGNATVFVANMDAAIQFYTEALGLKLTARFGNDWATVEAGNGFAVGLHPASPKYPAPGTRGAMTVGLEIDEPVEAAAERLRGTGARIEGEIERTAAGQFLHVADPDGNPIYLWKK